MTVNADTLNDEMLRQVESLLPKLDFSNRAQVSPLNRSENTVFLVEDPALNQKYVARVNSGRLSYHTRPTIESEMAWLKALRSEAGFPVPEVLSSPENETVFEIDLAAGQTKRFVSFYSFLNGQEPCGDNLVDGMQMLGQMTAKLHNHAKSWIVPPGFCRPAWSAAAILDDKLGWGHWRNGVGVEGETEKTLAKAEVILRARIEALPHDWDNYGLIHGDLRLANVLIDGDNISIIDFDDCGYGWFLFEMPAAISFIEDHPEIETLQQSWISGYKSVSSTGLDLLEELPSLLLLRRFALLAWLGYQKDHLEFAREIGPSFTSASVAQAKSYIARFG